MPLQFFHLSNCNLFKKSANMLINVAIIGLGIMGSRMLKHMRLHEEFNPNYLWDSSSIACENAIKQDKKAKVMKSANEAI